MDKKDDDNFDNHYGDSVFSITEDAQYPLFDAEKAKEGIITRKKHRPRTQKPENTKVNDDHSNILSSEPNYRFAIKPTFNFPVATEITLEEPLKLSIEAKDPLLCFKPRESFFPAKPILSGFSSLGKVRQIGPGTAKPLPIKNIPQTKPALAGELSPRMKMMPALARVISTHNESSWFSKVIPKVERQVQPVPVVLSPPTQVEEKKEETVTAATATTEQESVKSHKPAKQPAKKQSKKEAEDISETTSKQGLSGRKDVVYKTLLRSVKRYYSSEFESRTEYQTLTKSKQDKKCGKIIDKFTREMFTGQLTSCSEGESEKLTINGVEFSEVASFILALIIPSYVKRNCRNTPTYTIYDTFYECLYRYSHKRLESALAISSIACVFKIFLEGPVFENLLQNDGTLSKNREAFESAKVEFLDIISKENNQSSASA